MSGCLIPHLCRPNVCDLCGATKRQLLHGSNSYGSGERVFPALEAAWELSEEFESWRITQDNFLLAGTCLSQCH